MKVKIVYNLKDLPEWNPDKPIMFDIESGGLYVDVRLLQFYQLDTTEEVYILDLGPTATTKAIHKPDPFTWTEVREYLKPLWLVAYNASYDFYSLDIVPKRLDDLFYLCRIHYPKLEKFGLVDITTHLHLDYLYEGLDKAKLQKQAFPSGKTLSEDQIRYAATDVYCMQPIWENTQHHTEDPVYRLDNIIQRKFIGDWHHYGVPVNPYFHQQALAEIEKTVEENTKVLPEGLNINSYIQVRKILNSDRSDDEYLAGLEIEGHPYAKAIRSKRSNLKFLNFLEKYDRDRVKGFFNVAGAKSGRFTCSGGARDGFDNLTQIPRKLKHIFGFTEDSPYVMVGMDFSAIELRLMASMWGGKTMAEMFKQGKDLHIETAKFVTGKTDDISEEERKLAKGCNFGLGYGAGAEKFQSYLKMTFGILVDLEEAMRLRRVWFDNFPEYREYHKVNGGNFRRNNGLLGYTVMGRPVFGHRYTDALNLPIQGSGADLTKLTLHKLNQKEPGVQVINVVHDSITLQCLEEDAPRLQKLLKDSAEEAWADFQQSDSFIIKDVPLPVEVRVDKNYKVVT